MGSPIDDIYLLKEILFYIDDFYSYFITQAVCKQWYKILKGNEVEKLKQFSVHTIRNGNEYYSLPNKWLHGPCTYMICKKGLDLKAYVNYVRGKKEGVMEIIDEYSIKYSSINWVNGLKQGYKIGWHNNNNIYRRVYYVRGRKHGLDERWHVGGEPHACTHYVRGLKHGLEERWYLDGEISYSANWNYGSKHGTEIRFYQRGGRGIIITYRDGEEISATPIVVFTSIY